MQRNYYGAREFTRALKCWIAARTLSVCVVKTLIRSVTGDY
jgi:hypothetical protein